MKEMTFEETPSVPASSHTIGEAWRELWHNPSLFIRYWNYKGAILSGAMRAPIFLVTYLIGKESLKIAFAAALLQFTFRFAFAGVGGALIQSFRRVEPAWKALLSILMIVPLISHAFEFCIQYLFAHFTQTNDHTDEAIVRSICFSIVSALFSLFIMRRNVLIVGVEESRSLFSDIKRLPILIFEFCAFVPNEIAFMLRRRAFLSALAAIVAFGIFAQMMMLAITDKMFWTYKGGQYLPFLRFWGVDGLILLFISIALSALYYARREKSKKFAVN